jgi:hypothetical protein
MPRVASLTLTVALIGTALEAQEPSIALPDSLGARVPDEGTGLPTDYDRLIGRWRFRFQASPPPKPGKPLEYWPEAPGVWTFRRSAEGKVIADEFAFDAGGGTATFRIFNPQTRRWDIQGTDLGRGFWQAGVTWSEGDDRLVIQQTDVAGERVMRARYHFVSPDRFVWRADVTRDGGKTWVKDAMRLEAERIRDEAEAEDAGPSEASLLAAREAVWRDYFANRPDLASALPDDFVAIEQGDSVWADRGRTLANARASAERGTKLVSLEFPRNRIERYGPVAVIHSRYRAVLEGREGRQTMAGQATEVFRWTGTRWVHPSWHLDFDR